MMFWSTKTGISNKYSFSSSPTFTSEPWSVFTGRAKSSSTGPSNGNTRVSIFVFDKKQFEHYLSKYGIIKSKSSSRDKQLIQEGYEILRNQVNNLAKLKHPNILTLIEPLEEHSKNFMFVTEYVTGTLESTFKGFDDEQDFLKGNIKNDIITQRGIQQLVTGLDFIHNRANFVHLDIQPTSIFINDNSDWKISGLGHIMKLTQGTNSSDFLFPQYDPRIPQFYTFNLDYTAPELVFENTLSYKNDYFSLGLLINFLYTGTSLIKADSSLSDYKSEYGKFERKLSSLSWDSIFIKLPVKLRLCIPNLMNRDIYSRYDNITEFLDSEFFQDPLIKTLNFLDDLPTKSSEERTVFLDGLVELLPQYPSTLLQRKFLPILVDLLSQLSSEKMIDSHSVSRDLEIIIKIGSTVSQLTFLEKVFPVITNPNVFPTLLTNATMTFIENLSALKEKIKLDSFIEKILNPLLQYVLDKCNNENAVVLQEKLLDQMALILDCYDFPSIKNEILPILCNLFTKTTSLTIKIICMTCFESLIDKKAIDSYTCTETILPLFKLMKTRDSRILLKSLSLFSKIPTLITDEVVLVENLLPLLWNYSMASTLKRYQYSEFVKVINNLTRDIQKRHIEKLDNSKDSHEDINSFNKIIDTKTSSPRPADLDNQASKNVSVPIIQPVKKTSTATMSPARNNVESTSNKAPSLLSPKQVHDLRAKQPPLKPYRDVSNPPKSNVPPPSLGSSMMLPSNSQINNNTLFTNTTKNSTPVLSSTATMKNSSLNTHFSDNIMTPSTPSTNLTNQPSNNAILTRNNNQNRTNMGTNLPPGFSVSLQPAKKNSSEPSTFSNNNSGSLI